MLSARARLSSRLVLRAASAVVAQACASTSALHARPSAPAVANAAVYQSRCTPASRYLISRQRLSAYSRTFSSVAGAATDAFQASPSALELSASALFHVNTSPLLSVQQLPSQLPLLLSLRTVQVTHSALTPPAAVAPSGPPSSADADAAYASASVLAANDLIPVATVILPFVSAQASNAATGLDIASPPMPGADEDAVFAVATLLHRAAAGAARPVSAGLTEALLTLLSRQEAVVAEEAWTQSAQGASLGARATMKVLQWMQAEIDGTSEAAVTDDIRAALLLVAAATPGVSRMPASLISWCSALVHPRVHVPSAEGSALHRADAAAAPHAAQSSATAGAAGGAAAPADVETRANPLAAVFALRPGMVLTVYGYRDEVLADADADADADAEAGADAGGDAAADEVGPVAGASGAGLRRVVYSPASKLRRGRKGLTVAGVGVSPLPIDGPIGSRGTRELLDALETARLTGALDAYYASLHSGSAHGDNPLAASTTASPAAALPALLRYVLEHEHDPAALAVITTAAATGLVTPRAGTGADGGVEPPEVDPCHPAVVVVLDPNQSATGTAAAMLGQQADINRLSSDPKVHAGPAVGASGSAATAEPLATVADAAVAPGDAAAAVTAAAGDTEALRPPPPPELPVVSLRFLLNKATSPPSAPAAGAASLQHSIASNVHAAATHAQPLRGWMLCEEAAAAARNHAAVHRVYKAAWEPRAGKELTSVFAVEPPSAASGAGAGTGQRGRSGARRSARARALSPRSHSVFRQPVPAQLRSPSDRLFKELARADPVFAGLAAAGHAADPLNSSLHVLTVELPPRLLASPLRPPATDAATSGTGSDLAHFSLTATGRGAPHLLLSAPLPPEATLYSLAWPSIVRSLFPALSRARDDLSSLTHASSRVTRLDSAAAAAPGAAAAYAALFAAAERAPDASAYADADADAAFAADAAAVSSSGPTSSSMSTEAWRRAAASTTRFAAELVGDTDTHPLKATAVLAVAPVSMTASGAGAGSKASSTAAAAASAAAALLAKGAFADGGRLVVTSAVTQVSGLTGGERSALTNAATHITGKAVIVTSWLSYPVYRLRRAPADTDADAAAGAESERELVGLLPVATLSNKFTVLRGDVAGDYSEPGYAPERYEAAPGASADGGADDNADGLHFAAAFTASAPVAPFLDGLAADPGSTTAALAAVHARAIAAAEANAAVVPASFTVRVPLGLSSSFALVSGDHNPIHASAPVAHISPLTDVLEAVRAQLAAPRTATAASTFDAFAGNDDGAALVDMNRLIYSRPSRMRGRERGAAAVLASLRGADAAPLQDAPNTLLATAADAEAEQPGLRWIDVMRGKVRNVLRDKSLRRAAASADTVADAAAADAAATASATAAVAAAVEAEGESALADDAVVASMVLHTTTPVHGVALAGVVAAAMRDHLATALARDGAAGAGAFEVTGFRSEFVRPVTEGTTLTIQVKRVASQPVPAAAAAAAAAADAGLASPLQFEHVFTFQVRGLGFGIVPLSRTPQTPSLIPDSPADADAEAVQLVVTPASVALKPASQWNPSDPLIMKGGFTVTTESPALTAFCVPVAKAATAATAGNTAATSRTSSAAAKHPLSFVAFGGQGGLAARSAGLARGFLDPRAGADVEGSDAFIDLSPAAADVAAAAAAACGENAVGAAVWQRVVGWTRDSYGIPLDHIVNFNPSALRISLENPAVRWRWRRLLRMVIGGAAADTVERDAVAAAQAQLEVTAVADAGVDAASALASARAVREAAIASTAAQFHIPHWLLERYADVADPAVETIMLLGPATPTAPTGSSLLVHTESSRQGLLSHTHFQQLAVWTQEIAAFAQTQHDRRSAILAGAADAGTPDAGAAPRLYELDPGALYAGHSLGEFSAVAALVSDLDPLAADADAAAGAEGGRRLALESLAELVFLRGWLLQRCVPRDALGRSRLAMSAVFPSKLPFFSPAALSSDADAVFDRAVAEVRGCLERSASYSSVSSYRVQLSEVLTPRWYEHDDPYAYFLRLLAEATKIEVGRALAMMKETLLRVPERRVRSDPGILLEVVNHNSAGQQYMLAGSHLLLETFRNVLNALFRQRSVPSADTLVTIVRTSATAAVGDARTDISQLLNSRSAAQPVIPSSFGASALVNGHAHNASASAAATASAVHAAAFSPSPSSSAGSSDDIMGAAEPVDAAEIARMVATAADAAFPRIAEVEAQFGDELGAASATEITASPLDHVIQVPFVPFGQLPSVQAPTAPRVRSWLCSPRSSRASVGFSSVDTPFHSTMLANAVAPFRMAIARVLRGGSVYAEPEPGTAEPDLSGLSDRYVPNVLGDVVFSLSAKDPSLAASSFVAEAARKLGFVLPSGYSMPASTIVAEMLSRQLALPVLWGKTQALIASRLPVAAPTPADAAAAESSAAGSAAAVPASLVLEVSPEPVLGPMLQRFLSKPASMPMATASGPGREWAAGSVGIRFAPLAAERKWLVQLESEPVKASAGGASPSA